MDSKVLLLQVSNNNELNLDENVTNGTATKRWILDTLHGQSNRFDRLRHAYSVQKISYTTQENDDNRLFNGRVSIHFDGSRRPFEVFIKNDESTTIEQNMIFYHYVGEWYKCMALPRIYGYKVNEKRNGRRITNFLTFERNGCVLMDEFDGRTHDMADSFTISHCLRIITEIARFHSYTLYMLHSRDILKKFRKKTLHGEDHEGTLDFLKKIDNEFYANNKNTLDLLAKTASHKSEVRLVMPKVLIHGNLCPHNIYFRDRQNENKDSNTVIFIDWSTCAASVGIVDVLRFTLTSTSANVQKMCMHRFLKIYHDTMKMELRKHGVKYDYEFNALKEVYQSLFPYQLMYSITCMVNEYNRKPTEALKAAILERIKGGIDTFRTLCSS